MSWLTIAAFGIVAVAANRWAPPRMASAVHLVTMALGAGLCVAAFATDGLLPAGLIFVGVLAFAQPAGYWSDTWQQAKAGLRRSP